VSYNEQTLDNFYGHTAPVYKIRCSPFATDVFLSCSADWTAALWNQKTTKPILTFQSGHDYVMDVRWCPTNACVFATVSRDGRVEIWNLEESSLDPVIRHKFTEKSKLLSCVLFAPDSPVILSGGTDGRIDVFRVEGLELAGSWTSHQQSQRLFDAVYEHATTETNDAANATRTHSEDQSAE